MTDNNNHLELRKKIYTDTMNYASYEMQRRQAIWPNEERMKEDFENIQHEVFEILSDSYVEGIKRVRTLIIQNMVYFSQLSLFYPMDYILVNHSKARKYLKSDMINHFDDLYKVDEDLQGMYNAVAVDLEELKKTKKEYENASIKDMLIPLMNNEAERPLYFLAVYSVLRSLLLDTPVSENKEYLVKHDWFEPALISFSLLKEAKARASIGQEYPLSKEEEIMFSAWGAVVEYPEKDFLDFWNYKWGQVTTNDNPFLS